MSESEPEALVRGPRRTASVIRRALAMVLVVAVGTIGLALVPESAQAAVVQWGTNSGTAPNYQVTVNGDFLMTGNGVLACDSPINNATNVGTCANLHADTYTGTDAGNNVNDNFAMQNNNSVAGFTTNSSSGTVTIPSGAKVVKAFLNWAGNTGLRNGTTGNYCSAPGTNNTATLPTGSATGYRTQAVQLKVGSGAVTSVPVGTELEDATSQSLSYYYSAGADVTSNFASAASGSPLSISAGNIWTPTGAGCFAGWSITLVYDYGTYIVGNASSVPHRIIYYEGHVHEGAQDAALTVGFSGFTANGTGTRAGFTLFEGDRNISGDNASYSRQGSTTYTALPNSDGTTTTNFGTGHAIGSVRYTQTQDTSTFTNQSVDVITDPLTNVVAGDNQASLKLGTSGDSYLLRNAILSVPVAGVSIVKSYNGTADVQYRTNTEVATFTIVITNTGAGTLQNIVVSDDQPDCARSLGTITLTTLQSTTYTCTAAAASNASYTSTATVNASTVVGGYLANDSDSTAVVLSAITVAKSSALAPGATGRVGDTANYTFVVRNTGGGTLTGITLTDPLVGLSAITFGAWPSGTAGTLNAGQSVTATATYVLTQTDVDTGSVQNTATTVGTDQDGGPKPTGSATNTLTIVSNPALAVTKTGSYANGGTGKVGDVINYVFSATNTGNVTLKNGTLTDPLPGLSPPVVTWPTATAGLLAPGAKVTATASYTVIQKDVDNGSVKNTATATGTPPTGSAISAASPQSTVSTVAASPSIVTTKSGTAAGTKGVGSVITYSFSAKNTGNVTLTGVAINDPLPGLSARTYGSWPSGTAGTLAPGQTVTATATYTITQPDVDLGFVKNTATSVGTPPTGAAVTGASPQVTVATQASAPALALTKSGVLAPGATGKAGDTVNY